MMNYLRLLVVLLLPLPALVHAQDVVRVIVPYAPGGNVDSIARLYSKRAAELLNETWVVENLSGASGVIGTSHVARAAADGKTLLFSADVHSMIPLIVKNVPYDPIKDFQPVARLARAPLMFIVNSTQVKSNNLTELVGELKTSPEKYTFAISGAGSSPQLGAEAFKSRTGLNLLTVNYRGTAPAVQDVAGGHVNMMIVTPLSALPFMQNGKVKALAITSAKRFEGAPNVPTTAEAGMPGFEITNSYGFWAPKGIPKEALDRLSATLRKAAEEPAMKKHLLELGVSAMWDSPETFSKHIEVEYQKNRELLQKAGIKPE